VTSTVKRSITRGIINGGTGTLIYSKGKTYNTPLTVLDSRKKKSSLKGIQRNM
jgi:hypothetical protein